MPLPASSLSVVCEHIRDFVRTEIDAGVSGVEVTIGAPGGLATSDEHRLNLFFYRFEPSGFEAGARPEAPWRIRMFCMVTPFGIDEANGGTTISAGQNDMRMLGDAMRVFHETPILPPVVADGITVRTQAVFMSITDEQINQIWSTQGDTHYRPSVVYEMSLTPIVPEALAPEPRIVGAIGAAARAGRGRHEPFTGVAYGPPVPAVTIDVSDPAWVPAIAFVLDDLLHRSLAVDVDGEAFEDFTPEVWLAGDPDDSVELVWEAWRPTGWAAVGTPQDVTPHGPALDPAAIPAGAPGFPIEAPLPEDLADDQSSLQLLLYARRSFTRLDGGPSEIVRSAPLLVTLYRS
jgi:hypothetical protein